jgi:uncharacterized membrane protein
MVDIGLLPGDAFGFGRDVNNRSQVIGQSCTTTACRGFLWSKGTLFELESLGGTQTNPLSINSRGHVVGASRSATSGTATRAVLWLKGEAVDLNNVVDAGSGWVLQQATCINASGLIVGNGTFNGLPRAFLLTPRRE